MSVAIRASLALAVVLIAAPPAARAQSNSSFTVPAWAFPMPAPAPATSIDSVTLRHVPGSSLAFTQAHALDRNDIVDWYPRSHPSMPAFVAKGERGRVWACAYCHLPDGIGRPENAMLAGLNAEYIVRQMDAFKSHARTVAATWPYTPGVSMRTVGESATVAEARLAAKYFSRLRARQRSRVVEATDIPKVEPRAGLHALAEAGGTEPLGRRIVEVPESMERHELHDPFVSYVAYVPVGSIAAGKRLATAGRSDGLKACASCHGPQLRGVGPVPAIAGRAPSYLMRQLLAFRTGTRSSTESAPMREVAAKLDVDDMIAASAYAGSRKP